MFGDLSETVNSDINEEIANTLPVPDHAEEDLTFHCKMIKFDLTRVYQTKVDATDITRFAQV